MSGFFDELKRRKVYRVAIAYIVASWALAQGLAQVLPVFEIPNSVIRVVIALLLTGFPVALVLAWMFDITPSGIQRTSPIAAQSTASAHRRRNLVMLAVAGVLISACVGFFVLPRAAARKIDKSIAVLPFENLSDEKENAYFADGVQDDILTNLSKIGDLKVISRTSVMPYRGKTQNLRDIGKTLGVSNILEGSVRRSGNKVRVNVQLIDATNDQHLWAEDYDGDLSDVFKIQTDLATKIASALQAKLSPMEKEHLERKPTENGEAYLTFVQAQNAYHNGMEDFAKLKEGEQLFQRTIDLDPKFALAYARYSQLESWIVHSYDRTPERRAKVRSLAERALELQPDLPEGHLALGFSYYYGDNNYDAALREFEIAQGGLPNESDAYLAIGAIERRQGKWAQSTANLEKAATLNPKDSWPLQNLVFNYQMQRDFASANKVIDRALQIQPDGLGLWEMKAKLAISERGDLSIGQKCLEKAKTVPMSKEEQLKVIGGTIDFLLLQRKYKEALELAQNTPDDVFSTIPHSIALKYFEIGVAEKGLGDENHARAAFVKAKTALEENAKDKPDDPDAVVQLAKVHAWLGEREAALAGAQRAMQLRPESKDAFEGPAMTAQAAEIYAILGDKDHAIDLLDGLMSRPSDLTVNGLKLNPAWDPLRKDPRFQALIDKYGAKA
jgi:TolB-like protein/cytochrome c-type biogenesis protein CcmH/NrfG